MFNRKKKEIQQLQVSYNKLMDLRNELIIENGELQKKIEILNVQLSVLEKDNEDLIATNLDLENTIKQLKKDNRILKMKLTMLSKKIK